MQVRGCRDILAIARTVPVMLANEKPGSWIADQVAQGAAMKQLWDPMLVRAWQENNDAARAQLAALTVAQVAQFVATLELTSAEEVLATWQEHYPAELASLRAALADTPGSPAAAPRGARDLLARLWSLAADRGLDPLSLLAEASTSTNLASMVAKNPTKQNPYEPAAVSFLANATAGSRVAAVIQLSTVGIGIRFRSNGDWFLSNRQDRATKSADIAILVVSECGDRARWHLVAHKFARVAGGHQDNQREDALAFAEYARAGHRNGLMLEPLEALRAQYAPVATDVDWRPGLILDGAYFARSLPVLRAQMDDELEFVGDTDDWVAFLTSDTAAC